MVQGAEDRVMREEFMQMAQDELARVTHIVTQALRFHQQSRLPETVRLGEVAEGVLMLFRTRFSHAGAKLQLRDTQTEPLTCYVDDLRQVLSHLLANALDALTNTRGGTFHLRIAPGSSRGVAGVRLTLADTGSGIDPATMARLFQPFNTTKGIRGTGLGLWICRGVLQRRGGDLRIRSKVGKGTVARIFLPLQPVESVTDASVDEFVALGLVPTAVA
jgi:two-component system, NtrC family, sensor kinase